MSSFSLHIATDNAAFRSCNRPEAIAEILADVGRKLANGADAGTVRDENGNTCGRWFLTDRDQQVDDAAALDGIAQQLAAQGHDNNDSATTLDKIAATVGLTGR